MLSLGDLSSQNCRFERYSLIDQNTAGQVSLRATQAVVYADELEDGDTAEYASKLGRYDNSPLCAEFADLMKF